ncbi:sugar transferase [Nonlabens sp. SY33080]|uniref:sugar transferase n=1 Tax=Nonlabens sp. SY33080 TaxID=2719911 RepID=UPI001428D2AB|nr:sugar transferase [Nonlabens sp. SY33080]
MKRSFDVVLSFLLLQLLLPPLLFVVIFSSSLIFTQYRIGKHGEPFLIYKLKTMQNGKVTRIGKWLRKYKIDELPQLWNILKGEMSFVGPRPDIPGYYDNLKGEQRKVLLLKPGLTSLAAIKYRNEELLLSQQVNPLEYNDIVIFPDKVRMNLEYLDKRSFLYDLKIIILTIKSLFN